MQEFSQKLEGNLKDHPIMNDPGVNEIYLPNEKASEDDPEV